MQVNLTRYAYLPDCTLGQLEVGPVRLWTLEPPWKKNERFVSCVPEGFYELKKYSSVKYLHAFELLHVPARDAILIHCGNVVSDSAGCVLIGAGRKVYQNEHRVTQSRYAMTVLQAAIKEPAFINIQGLRAVYEDSGN